MRLLLFCLLFASRCYNQSKISDSKNDYFDVKEFYENNPHGKYKVDTLKNGSVIE